MAYEITDLARQFSPWSISKAGVAQICPHQYQYKYLLKTTDAVEGVASTPSGNRVGTTAHAILELRVGGQSHADAKRAALLKTPLMSNEMDALRALEKPVEWFMQKWAVFCRTHEVVEVLTERKWGFTEDMQPCAFFAPNVYFRGAVDLGAITKAGDLIVVDHKSGVAKDIKKDDTLKRQLYSYAVMALANVPQLQGVRSAIHFLQGPETKRIQWLDYIEVADISNNKVPWLFNYLNFCAACLVPPFIGKPKLKFPCAYCAYQKICEPFRAWHATQK